MARSSAHAIDAQISTASCTRAITAGGRKQHWREAVLLAAAMPTMRIQHDVISYNATITACERLNHWQRALQILHSMPGAHIETDVVGTSSYNSTLSCLERWSVALSFCSEALERSMSDVVSHNTSLRRLADGDWRLALWSFGEMPKQGVQRDAISRNAAMKALTELDWQMALELFAAFGTTAVLPSVVSYGTALSCTAGSWQGATKFLQDEMRVGKIRSNCYTFGSFLTSLSDWRQSLDVLGTMEPRQPQIDSSGAPWDLVTCNAALASAAFWRLAMQLLRSMGSRALQGDVDARWCWKATHSSALAVLEWQLALAVEERAQGCSLRGNQISDQVLLTSFLRPALWQLFVPARPLVIQPAAAVVPGPRAPRRRRKVRRRVRAGRGGKGAAVEGSAGDVELWDDQLESKHEVTLSSKDHHFTLGVLNRVLHQPPIPHHGSQQRPLALHRGAAAFIAARGAGAGRCGSQCCNAELPHSSVASGLRALPRGRGRSASAGSPELLRRRAARGAARAEPGGAGADGGGAAAGLGTHGARLRKRQAAITRNDQSMANMDRHARHPTRRLPSSSKMAQLEIDISALRRLLQPHDFSAIRS
eukprot:s257_g42.t2